MKIGTMITGVCVTLMGLMTIAFGWYVMSLSTDFEGRAFPVSATVIGIEVSDPARFAGDTEENRTRRTGYYAVVRYEDYAGRVHEVTSRRGTADPDFVVGDTVDILYDPDNPTHVELATEEYPLAAFAFFAILGGVFVVVGALTIRHAWRDWVARIARRREP